MTVGVLPAEDPGVKKNIAYWRKRLFFKEQVQFKALIQERGGYGPSENEEIYERYFKYEPNRLHYFKEKYQLDQKKVLEIGCARGEFLLHFGPGSLGLDLDSDRVEFLERLGLNSIMCNIEEEIPVEDESFDVVWSSNVLEHVVAPHLMLRKAHRKLRPNGLLMIAVPTIPSFQAMEKLTSLAIGWVGYRSMEHINGFTKRTVEFMIERAQFDIVESGVYLTSNPLLNFFLQPVVSMISSQVVVVARKSETRERPWIYAPSWAREAQ